MFGLGTFVSPSGEPFPGLVIDDQVVDVRRYFGADTTTIGLLRDWETSLERLRKIAASSTELIDPHPLTSLRSLPPVQPLGQVLCAGANYYRHTVEMSLMVLRTDPDQTGSDAELQAEAVAITERQRSAGMPFLFSGLPSAVVGAGDDVVLWGPGVQHDWELELTVVIGRAALNVSVADAMDYVAGYTICNDISTRDVMFRPRFALSDFLMSKSRPTFFPTGPFIVPREFVPDYRQLRIQLMVNGEVMQDETVDDIMYGIEELVAYASTVTELQPGDLLLTGSPAGNAAVHGNRWLKPGDVLEGQITGLGKQRNVCIADPRVQ